MIKKFLTRIVSTCFALFACVATAKAGESIYAHGSSFTPWTSTEAGGIYHNIYGIVNTANVSKGVYASVDHTSSRGGMSVKIWGRHYGSRQLTTSCTVYALNSSGSLIASVSRSVTVSESAWTMFFPLIATGDVTGIPVVAYCTLPAQSTNPTGFGYIMGYESVVS